MMSIIIDLLGKGVWAGAAAIGFAILFNVPRRTLTPIFFLACIGTITKFTFINLGIGIILSSFAGASLVGIIGIYAAKRYYGPPLVFSIPSVIPMVPGVFAYNMMLGFMDLSATMSHEEYIQVLSHTTSNGLKALFIIMGLATGVALPMLIARKESFKHIEHHKN